MVVRSKGRVVREQFSVDLASGVVHPPIQLETATLQPVPAVP